MHKLNPALVFLHRPAVHQNLVTPGVLGFVLLDRAFEAQPGHAGFHSPMDTNLPCIWRNKERAVSGLIGLPSAVAEFIFTNHGR